MKGLLTVLNIFMMSIVINHTICSQIYLTTSTTDDLGNKYELNLSLLKANDYDEGAYIINESCLIKTPLPSSGDTISFLFGDDINFDEPYVYLTLEAGVIEDFDGIGINTGDIYFYENNTCQIKKEEFLFLDDSEIKKVVMSPIFWTESGKIEYDYDTSRIDFEQIDEDTYVINKKIYKYVESLDHMIPIVSIGSQYWMLENLSTEKFQNGMEIPKYNDWNVWKSVSSAGVFEYGREKYYNEPALLDEKNICPTGFHVPNQEELVDLLNFINKENQIKINKKATVTGKKDMKSFNINGLVSKEVRTRELKYDEENYSRISNPTNEYKLNLNLSNRLIYNAYGGKTNNFTNGVIVAPFTWKTKKDAGIYCIAFQYGRNKTLFNYVNVVNWNRSSTFNESVFYIGEVLMPKKQKKRKELNAEDLILDAENTTAYPVRCIMD